MAMPRGERRVKQRRAILRRDAVASLTCLLVIAAREEVRGALGKRPIPIVASTDPLVLQP